MKKVYVASLFAALVMILTACGGGTAETVTFDIDMAEYSFSPERLNLKVGQEVTINLSNSGQLQHEIMFGREMMKTDNRPALPGRPLSVCWRVRHCQRKSVTTPPPQARQEWTC